MWRRISGRSPRVVRNSFTQLRSKIPRHVNEKLTFVGNSPSEEDCRALWSRFGMKKTEVDPFVKLRIIYRDGQPQVTKDLEDDPDVVASRPP